MVWCVGPDRRLHRGGRPRRPHSQPSRAARGSAGGTHPSPGQGRRTQPSRRSQAADSSEPPTSRTKKRSIDMSRRRLRDTSRRTCSQIEAPPLTVGASSFVRPLRAWEFDEPLLDRSRAHPADGPQSLHVQNVFGEFLRQPHWRVRRTSKQTRPMCLVISSVSPTGVLEAQRFTDQSPAMH